MAMASTAQSIARVVKTIPRCTTGGYPQTIPHRYTEMELGRHHWTDTYNQTDTQTPVNTIHFAVAKPHEMSLYTYGAVWLQTTNRRSLSFGLHFSPTNAGSSDYTSSTTKPLAASTAVHCSSFLTIFKRQVWHMQILQHGNIWTIINLFNVWCSDTAGWATERASGLQIPDA